MKQSRATSLFKSVVSTAVGFGVALVANATVLPLFGFHPNLAENLQITCIYTVISIARGYGLERMFEAFGWRTRMSAFTLAVIAERQRQITEEGWTADHDDGHTPREMARAGAAYLVGADQFTAIDYARDDEPEITLSGRIIWPWELDYWKPRDLRDDLVRGCALGLAAGDLSDRRRRKRSAS